jgi:RNA polymerase sigma factor FliA
MVAAPAPRTKEPQESYLRVVREDEPAKASRAPLTWLPTTNRQAMICQHMPLVRYVAGRMARHANTVTQLDFDDLVGYGTEGLIEAVDSFNSAFNVRFSTWAVMHIRTTIQDALRDLDPLPRSLRSKGKEIDRARYALANAHGTWPEDSDVAAELGISLERLRRLQQSINRRTVSLEQALTSNEEDGADCLLESLADDDPETNPESRLEEAATIASVQEAIAGLPERERLVMERYYKQGASMRAISEQLGISESRVSQLHARALTILRQSMQGLL